MTLTQIHDELDLLVGPGHTILECIDQQNITLHIFAFKIHMTCGDLIMLIMGKIPIDQDIAMKLSSATGLDHEFWLNSETLYRSKIVKIAQGIAGNSVS